MKEELVIYSNQEDLVIYKIEDFFPFEENLLSRIENDKGTLLQEESIVSILDNRIQQIVYTPIVGTSFYHPDFMYVTHFTNILEIDNGELRRNISAVGAIKEQITRESEEKSLERIAIIRHAEEMTLELEKELHRLYEQSEIEGILLSEKLIILQEPLIVGHTWDRVGDTGTSKITSMNETVETPLGTFENVMEVTTLYPNGDKSIVYLAQGYGIIKSIYTLTGDQGSNEIQNRTLGRPSFGYVIHTTFLTSIERDATFEIME
ncbi:MAG: hypothetical protein FWE02_05215 [Defluviitaleaceae bacterium]|nr:hypothetical protein [Defluviitaleaceae bacterium]